MNMDENDTSVPQENESPSPKVIFASTPEEDAPVTSTPKFSRRRKSSIKLDRCSDRFTMADVTLETDTSVCNRKKGKGKRRQNRLENVRYLLSLWDKEIDESKLSCVKETNDSVFTRVLTEENKRKIWDEFASLSGEEQDSYLKFIEESKQRTAVSSIKDGINVSNPAFRLGESELPGNTTDSNLAHATNCYKRIEEKLKKTLNEPRLPLDVLRGLEEEIISFFTRFPSSQYSVVLSNSYERLLLHALCQYLGLSSNSINKKGGRWTKVEKQIEEFTPPAIPLSDFIEKHR